MTAQPEHSQCPLVEMDSITSLLIVYRYDITTGIFTVPPGGDGFYYFSVFLVVNVDEYGTFDLDLNGETLCTAYADTTDTPDDEGTAACSATTYAVAGLLLSSRNIYISIFIGPQFYLWNNLHSDSYFLVEQGMIWKLC